MVSGVLKDPWVEFICGPKHPSDPDIFVPPPSTDLLIDLLPSSDGPPIDIRTKRQAFSKTNIEKICAKKEQIIAAMQMYLRQNFVGAFIEMCNSFGNGDYVVPPSSSSKPVLPDDDIFGNPMKV